MSIAAPDHQRLLADLLAQNDSGRSIDVILIANEEDGLTRIGETLASRRDLAAVHIIGHGTSGTVWLGSSELDQQILAHDAPAFSQWARALTGDADILIYGCDVAASAAGQHLVDTLAALTGADVAASDDLTGTARLGGDWILGYRRGDIDTDIALSVETQATWAGVLAAPQLDLDTNNSAGSTQSQIRMLSPM